MGIAAGLGGIVGYVHIHPVPFDLQSLPHQIEPLSIILLNEKN
jgi:hypothetical protein